MSVEDAKQLIAKMQTDPELRQKFQQAGEQAFATAASDAGHQVSASDMHAALREINVGQLETLKPQVPGGGSSIVAVVSVAVI